MKYGSDRLYLEHILDALAAIESYVVEGETAFLHDRKTQDAVIRNLEIIGEAVKYLSAALINANPEIAWRDIAGNRDRLIHGYFLVDLHRVWNTVTRDLPVLKSQIAAVIAQIDSRGLEG
jgi:uncharacterized protein with HEPN domain